jgi:hypothetical protein
MKLTLIIVRALLSLVGTALLVSGVFFWFGRGLSFLPLHMMLGLTLVVLLWIIIALALYARASPGFALFVLAWSLIVPILGATQMALLPGSLHWIIRTIHLLVGGAAIGLGQALAKRITAGRAVAAAVAVAE